MFHLHDGYHSPKLQFFWCYISPAGPEGNYDNCGVGQGKGSKLNIPLNAVSKNFKTIPEQTPGDNEYIYIYERIIHPIIA